MNLLDESLKAEPGRATEELAEWKKRLASMRGHEVAQDLRIVELDYEKSKLELKVAALSRLLVQTGVVDADQLAAMMEAIDAEDGRADGRVTPADPGRTPFVAGV